MTDNKVLYFGQISDCPFAKEVIDCSWGHIEKQGVKDELADAHSMLETIFPSDMVELICDNIRPHYRYHLYDEVQY